MRQPLRSLGDRLGSVRVGRCSLSVTMYSVGSGVCVWSCVCVLARDVDECSEAC